MKVKKIKIGKKYIQGILINLLSKNFILLRGSRGYIMCGYLNLSVARKFNDVALKIVGISTIEEALKAKVHSLSPAARKLGLYKGQPIKEAVKIIA